MRLLKRNIISIFAKVKLPLTEKNRLILTKTTRKMQGVEALIFLGFVF